MCVWRIEVSHTPICLHMPSAGAKELTSRLYDVLRVPTDRLFESLPVARADPPEGRPLTSSWTPTTRACAVRVVSSRGAWTDAQPRGYDLEGGEHAMSGEFK